MRPMTSVVRSLVVSGRSTCTSVRSERTTLASGPTRRTGPTGSISSQPETQGPADMVMAYGMNSVVTDPALEVWLAPGHGLAARVAGGVAGPARA